VLASAPIVSVLAVPPEVYGDLQVAEMLGEVLDAVHQADVKSTSDVDRVRRYSEA
jgi:hypothetical protein